MRKIILVTLLTVILLTVSFTSVSALSPENEQKLNDKIKSLEKKIKDLFAENTKLKNDIVKLKTENTKLKTENTKLKTDNGKFNIDSILTPKKLTPVQDIPKSTGYPNIDKRYSGIEAKEKIKELFNFHNSMTVPQRLIQISKNVQDSDFVFVIIVDGEWRMTSYNRYNTSTYDAGDGVTVIPFDCSHNRNYLESSVLQKLEDVGMMNGIIFKNGVAIGTGSTEKPYGMAAISVFCDTGGDADESYLKTLS